MPSFPPPPRAFFHPARFFAFAFLAAASLRAEPREWTSTDGRRLTAEFVSASSTSVKLRRPDNQLVDIPLDRLSAEDRAWLVRQASPTAPAGKSAPLLSDADKKARSLAEKRAAFLKGPLTYRLSDGSEKWPEERRRQIVEAMDAAVAFLNEHGKFEKAVTANNSPGTPTADANWNGWINWGGSISRRVALHEIAHTLGVGTHSKWRENIQDGKWTGRYALRQLREFDGPDAVLHADRQHFWPYGLNFDNESSPENDLRFVKMVAALRKDMGIE